MRNPWSTYEWKGDWSDSSSKWNAANKAEVKYDTAGNEGTFWMPYEKYIKEFWGYSLTLYQEYKGYGQIDMIMS